jgi:hypothetical protein
MFMYARPSFCTYVDNEQALCLCQSSNKQLIHMLKTIQCLHKRIYTYNWVKEKGFRMFKSKSGYNKKFLLGFAVLFSLVGLILIKTFAATTQTASVEAEKMTLPAGVASVVTDNKASGGQAIGFLLDGAVSSNLAVNGSSNNLQFVAKSAKCKGGWPTLNVSVDSIKIYSATISSTRWKTFSYTLPSNIESGTHQLSVVASGVGSVKGCVRTAYLDKVNFYGDGSQPAPAPTVTLTASPLAITSGGSSTLTWNTTGATSCTASGSWSGSKATAGSVSTGALSATSTYALSCTGAGGTSSASVIVTVSAVQIPPAPTIYLNPLTKSYAQGTTFTVELREDSGTQLVNAVQANLTYPTDKLDFVSIDTTGSAFSTQAQNAGGNGQIAIARGNTTAQTGNQLVAKITFRTKAITGTVTVPFVSGTQLVSSTTNKNILSSLSATGGGSYVVQ